MENKWHAWIAPCNKIEINLWYLEHCSTRQSPLSEAPVRVLYEVLPPAGWVFLTKLCTGSLKHCEDSSRKAGPVIWHPGEGLRGSAICGGRVLGQQALWLAERPYDRFKSPTEAACSLSAINTAGSGAGILDGGPLRKIIFSERFCFFTQKINFFKYLILFTLTFE